LTDDTPWQRYEVPGSTQSTVVTKPAVIAALLKKAAHPLIVAAHLAEVPACTAGNPVEIIIRIADAGKIPVITTPSTAPAFRKRGYNPTATLSIMEIGSRLNDPGWSVSDDHQHPDLVLFIGFPYIMGWLLQSGLKSFAPKGIRFISIDQRYQPHCTLSLPNLPRDEWVTYLNAIADEVGCT
jgi:CO dehydrogenase/acetyl-CoA synthase complex epsilon subunit